ncbi:Protein of unknown function [Bacillus cytotoxicus]|nr:Protein of unknown function [Bacillus cytotoxicus]
MVCNKNIDEEE